MSSDLQSTKLESLITFSNGRSSPERSDDREFPVFGSNGLIGWADETNSPANSIVIGRVGSYCGSVHFSPSPCWVTDNAIRATAKGENDSSFLYYLLKQLDLNNWRSGSGQPLINQATLNSIEVTVPEPSSQKLIGGFISSLDDRITLLRETNATLEAIAQALFKSWFVDFDPVHAKAEGRARQDGERSGQPRMPQASDLPRPGAEAGAEAQGQPEAMDATTSALFPDSFEESELGLVPKGWAIGCVGDLASQKKGSVNPLASPEVLFEHYSLPAFDSGQAPVIELGQEIKSNKTPLPEEAVLLSKLNPHIPRVWLPVRHGTNAVCSTEFLAYSPLGSASKEFIYCLFSSEAFQQQLCQLVTGTSNSHQRVKPDQVLAVKLPIADRSVLKAFAELAKPLFERVHANRQQAQTLTQLRDTLLPRLISGQLRLPELPLTKSTYAD